MAIQSILNKNSYQNLALGTIAFLSIAILGCRFFLKKRIEPVNNEALIHLIKNKAREITPLVDKLGPKNSTFWSDFVKNQGVFTDPGTLARIDLKNKEIYLERVNRVALEAACKSIQGDIVCEFNNSNTQEPYLNYYYRNGTVDCFSHFIKKEQNLSAEAEYQNLINKKDTVHFKIYTSQSVS